MFLKKERVKMDRLQEDISRGCLENGEPLEACWGTGYWSEEPEQEPEPEVYQKECPICGCEESYSYGYGDEDDDHVYCKNCRIDKITPNERKG